MKPQPLGLFFIALTLAVVVGAQTVPLPGAVAPPPGVVNNLPANLVPSNYVLGTGDEVAIMVFGTPEFNRTLTVGADGTIAASYLKKPLRAGGLTSDALAASMAARLREAQLVVDPQVEVAVVAARSHMVTVGGAVKQPQVIYLTEPITVLDAILRAGGPDADKAGATVAVTIPPAAGASGPGVTRAIPYDRLGSTANSTDNPLLHGGEHVDLRAGGMVFVAGGITKPGAFPITASAPLTVSKAIAMSGGWVLVGSKPDQAVIVRTLPDGEVQHIKADLPRIMDLRAPDISLMANDIIFVPLNDKKRVMVFAATSAVSSLTYAIALLATR